MSASVITTQQAKELLQQTYDVMAKLEEFSKSQQATLVKLMALNESGRILDESEEKMP